VDRGDFLTDFNSYDFKAEGEGDADGGEHVQREFQEIFNERSSRRSAQFAMLLTGYDKVQYGEQGAAGTVF